MDGMLKCDGIFGRDVLPEACIMSSVDVTDSSLFPYPFDGGYSRMKGFSDDNACARTVACFIWCPFCVLGECYLCSCSKGTNRHLCEDYYKGTYCPNVSLCCDLCLVPPDFQP